ncbi:MAG: SpoIID/LytB domain-containing protein [Candidatus Omnitrophota bacterium]
MPYFIYAQDCLFENMFDSAACLVDGMQYEKAKEISKAKLKDYNDDDGLLFLSKIFYLSSDLNSARIALERIKDKDWLTYFYFGLIFEDTGDLSSAVSNYEKSLNLKHNSPAMYRLAKIYFAKRDYKSASTYFSLLISLDPSWRLAYYYLGECYLKLSNYTEAYKYLAKALNFYPDKESIKEKISKVKEKLGLSFFEKREIEEQNRRSKAKLKSYRKKTDIALVRVGIAEKLKEFTFRSGGDFIVSGKKNRILARANVFYTFVFKDEKCLFYDGKENKLQGTFEFPVEISPVPSTNRLDNNQFKEYLPFYVLDLTYGEGSFWHKKIDRILRGNLKLIAKGKSMTLLNVLSIEEYLYGVVPAEISSNSPHEALKAQAIAARTIALRRYNSHKKDGFDLCADVHCQVYHGMSVESKSANRAVDETADQILVYEGRPIEAFYHSNCGGCLRSDTFGDIPYLEDKFDSTESNFEPSPYNKELWFMRPQQAYCDTTAGDKFRWQRIYDAEDFFFAFGYSLNELKAIVSAKNGNCFHNGKVEIIKSGQNIFLNSDYKMRNYFDQLKSSSFNVELKRNLNNEPEFLFFWGAGFGHASGLCQEGAIGMAKEGFNYRQILKHYYPGASIKKGYRQ